LSHRFTLAGAGAGAGGVDIARSGRGEERRRSERE